MNNIEREIYQSLKSKMDTGLIADNLLKTWLQTELSEEEVQSAWTFFSNEDLLPSLVSHITNLVKVRRSVPWPNVIKLILSSLKKENFDIVSEIFPDIEDQLNEKALHLRVPKSLEGLFASVTQKARTALEDRVHSQINDGAVKVDALIRMNERERASKLLEPLILKFPTSNRLKDLNNELGEYQIQKLTESKSKNESRSILDKVVREENEVLKQARKEIIREMLKVAKKQKSLSYDIAISLAMMGSYQDALSLVEKMPPSLRTDFLKLELLVETRQFVSALQWADEVDEEHARSSQTLLETMYHRARALWGLNQKESALKLMNIIADQKPHFRLALSLAETWRRELE